MDYPLEHPLKTLQVITDCVHAQADISLDGAHANLYLLLATRLKLQEEF